MQGQLGILEQYSKHTVNNLTLQDIYKNAASSTSALVLVSNPVQDSWSEWRQIYLAMVFLSGTNLLH